MKGSRGLGSWQPEQDPAKERDGCPRCQGLMVPSFMNDLRPETVQEGEWWSRRCVNCGECLDPTITQNRRILITMGSSATRVLIGRRRWTK
jgi:hypothetical protein